MNRSDKEMRASIARNVTADYLVRGVAWACWLALVAFLVLPLAWLAFLECGAVVALVILALLLGTTWHVKPQGKSYAARVREIGRGFPD